MKNAWVRGSIAALVLACGNVNAQEQEAPSLSDEIAFVSIRNGNAHIFTNHGPGSDKPLTSGNSVNTQPAWSHDGTQIAFTSNREGLTKIFVMARDGGNVRRLTRDDRIEVAPSWSPDNKYLAFYSSDKAQSGAELRIVDVESGDVVSVIGNGLDKGPEIPVWSGDSERLAFIGLSENHTNEVWVVNRDGSDARAISTQASSRNKAHPAFSPTSNKVAYIADMKGPMAIIVTDLDNGLTTNLTEGVMAAHEHPRWSRDGKQLLFASSRDDEMRTRSDIFVMDADGGNLRNLSKHPQEDFDPQWTADDRQVVFTSLRSGTAQIFAVDVGSGKTIRVTDNASHDMEQVARPVGD